MLTPTQWLQFTSWWRQTAKRLGVDTQCESFLAPESGGMEALMKVHGAEGDLDYVLFVMIRYWVPPVLPPAGKERTGKSDPDYWIESERLRIFLIQLAAALVQSAVDQDPLPGTLDHVTRAGDASIGAVEC